jgi:peptide deformylase
MPLKAPSFFDDLKRMRTPSRNFDPNMNFGSILEQLTESCRTFRYLGISPQNLREPALLLKAIVMKDKREFSEFVEPVIILKSGQRLSYEACGNIYLHCDGERFHTGVLVKRPTKITVRYRTRDGKVRRNVFHDVLPHGSRKAGFVGVFCHELEHLEGRLIVDIARESLGDGLNAIIESNSREEKAHIASDLPSVLIRDGDRYVFRHGLECTPVTIPPVSPDALYVSGNLCLRVRRIEHFKVPRAGEQLRIQFSDYVKWLRSRI